MPRHKRNVLCAVACQNGLVFIVYIGTLLTRQKAVLGWFIVAASYTPAYAQKRALAYACALGLPVKTKECYFLFPSAAFWAKWAFVMAKTTGLNKIKATRLGMAMQAFRVSERSHTKSSLATAPKGTTQT
jgi:hypothetical protein